MILCLLPHDSRKRQKNIASTLELVKKTLPTFISKKDFLLVLSVVLVAGILLITFQATTQISSLSITSEVENSKLNEVNLLSESITVMTRQVLYLSTNYQSSTMELFKTIDNLHSKKSALIESLDKDKSISFLTIQQSKYSLILLLSIFNFILISIVLVRLLINHKNSENARKSMFYKHIENSIDFTKSDAPTASYEALELLFKFYEALKEGSNLPILHGIDKTAKKIGISSAQAKRIVANLIEFDLIEVAGKRLRLKK